MHIVTSTILHTFSGKPMVDQEGPITLGKILSLILVAPREQGPKFDPLKAYTLGSMLSTQESVDLDDADAKKLTEMVDTDKSLSMMITGQILKLLSDQK